MPWLGVEPGLDALRGYDAFDQPRSETTLSSDLLFYLNPRDAVQLFGLFGASVAFVRHSDAWAHSNSDYLGVQAGFGLEFRVTHRLSFNVNAVATSRKLAGARSSRTTESSQAEPVPESSSGFMLRASTALYF